MSRLGVVFSTPASRQDFMIRRLKVMIENDSVSVFQEEIESILQSPEPEVAWDYVYQQVYLHACLKKKHDMVRLLETVFPKLDSIQQIGLRQIFSYGRYLQNRHPRC